MDPVWGETPWEEWAPCETKGCARRIWPGTKLRFPVTQCCCHCRFGEVEEKGHAHYCTPGPSEVERHEGRQEQDEAAWAWSWAREERAEEEWWVQSNARSQGIEARLRAVGVWSRVQVPEDPPDAEELMAMFGGEDAPRPPAGQWTDGP